MPASIGPNHASSKAGEKRVISGKSLRIEAPDGGLRVLQWNILADGLSDDGFLVRERRKDMATQTDDEICQQVARLLRLKKEGTAQDMENLSKELATKEARALNDAVTDWKRRWLCIKAMVREHGPHIITMQEVDHMTELERDLGEMGYECGLPGRKYRPVHKVEALNVKGDARQTVREYFSAC